MEIQPPTIGKVTREQGKARSLRTGFLSLSISLVVGLVAAFFVIVTYRDAQERFSGLQDKLNLILDSQTILLAGPLVDQDVDSIVVILAPVLADPDIAAVAIKDLDGKVIEHFGEPLDTINSDYLAQRDIISVGNGRTETIGSLVLGADQSHVIALLTVRAQEAAILSILVIVAIIGGIQWSLQNSVITPLARLLRNIKEGEVGSDREEVVWHRDDEIGRLIKAFNAAQHRQAYYENELREAQQLLEKRVEERTRELKSARDDARAANTAKSSFLANMSHELRTPLNGVLGMASTLLAEDLKGSQREKLEIIHKSGENLLTLLNDILDLAKVEAGQMQIETVDFSLRELLETVEDLWRPKAAEKQLDLVIDVSGLLNPYVSGDPFRLQQVLFNFVSNAIKFTKSGSVTVRLSQTSLPRNRQLCVFEVEDTGIGIKEEAQSQLFAKFVQAEESTTRHYGGTGLGLSICKELVELMGGTIEVFSQPGEGSVFGFEIEMPICEPVACSQLDSTAPVPGEGPQNEDRQVEILVAEDNPINQTVIRTMLAQTGCQTETVNNGLEAIAALKGKAYDLVLMDVHMPECDGFAATKSIRQELNLVDLPIIALTADAMMGDRERCLQAGMNDYLTKPVDRNALLSVIRKWSSADGPTSEPESLAPTTETSTAMPAEDDDQAAILQDVLRIVEGFDTGDVMELSVGDDKDDDQAAILKDVLRIVERFENDDREADNVAAKG